MSFMNRASNKASNSVGKALVGLGIVIAMTALLWWNEGNYVYTKEALLEIQANFVEPNDSTFQRSDLEKKIIYLKGEVTTEDVLQDPITGVAKNTLSLERKTQFYQNVEKSETNNDDEEEYYYQAEWCHDPVDSNEFHERSARSKYRNSVILSGIGDTTFVSKNATLGAYGFAPSLIEEMDDKALDPIVPDNFVQSLNNKMNAQGSNLVHHDGTDIYLGDDPSHPAIGDIRVYYSEIPVANVSVIAYVENGTLKPYVASNNYEIALVTLGDKTAAQMIETAFSDNVIETWVFRIFGLICIAVGGFMMCASIAHLLTIIPVLGDILALVIGFGLGMAGAIVSTLWGILVIAIAWFRFRPIYACLMIALLIGMVVYGYIKRKKTGANNNNDNNAQNA